MMSLEARITMQHHEALLLASSQAHDFAKAQSLLDKGVSFATQMPTRGWWDTAQALYNVLHLAILQEDTILVNWLLTHNHIKEALWDKCDPRGHTPLTLAKQLATPDVLAALSRNETVMSISSPKLTDKIGETAKGNDIDSADAFLATTTGEASGVAAPRP